MPAARSTVTPAVALVKLMRVLPLPVRLSSPPFPVNSLNVPKEPALVLAGEAGRIIRVGEIGASHGLDRDEPVGTDGGIAGDGSCSEMHHDAGCRRRVNVIVGAIKTPAPINGVVAGEARKYLDRAETIVAAGKRIGERRAEHRKNPRSDKGVVTD